MRPQGMYHDEETLSILTSQQETSDLAARLDSLGHAFVAQVDTSRHGELRRAAQEYGLKKSDDEVDHPLSTSLPPPVSFALPQAFSEPEGKRHLSALGTLLKISESEAAALTTAALAALSLETGDPNRLRSLLGTRRLVFLTVEYYHQQRVFRLLAVAECLRLEQDPDFGERQIVAEFLKGLDDRSSDSRGIFWFLLLTSIEDVTPYSDVSNQLDFSEGGDAWTVDSFANTRLSADLCETQRVFAEREQLEALQALVVLLYRRCALGLADIGYLLMALQSKEFFVESSPKSHLAAIVCTEAVALWKIGDSHPLLSELPASLSVLQSLLLVVQHLIIQRPEDQAISMAVLSIGMAFKSSSHDDVTEAGNRLVQIATKDLNALENLSAAMKKLVVDEDTLAAYQETTPETDVDLKELSANSIICATIGRELLNAALKCLSGALLSTRNSNLETNLNFLCDLAGTTNCNSPLLSEAFWQSWRLYSQPGGARNSTGLCLLVDSAYKLAVDALERAVLSEILLSSVAPLLRFVSAFVSSSEHVQTVVSSMLPHGLLSRTLDAAREQKRLMTPSASCQTCLRSINTLASIATSKSCNFTICAALDGSGVTGSSLLLQLALTWRGETSNVCLSILANLVGGSAAWFRNAVECIGRLQDTENTNQSGLFRHGGGDVEDLSLVLAKLLREGASRAFEDDGIDDALVETLVDVVVAVVATISTPGTSLNYESSDCVLQCAEECLRFVIVLQENPRYRPVGERMSKRINEMFVSNHGALCNSLLTLGVAPVMLSIARVVAQNERANKTLHSLSRPPHLALFKRVPLDHVTTATGGQKNELVVEKALSDPAILFLDFEDIKGRGWLQNQSAQAPLRCARRAFTVLLMWLRASTGYLSHSPVAKSVILETLDEALSTTACVPQGLNGVPAALCTAPTMMALSRYFASQNPHMAEHKLCVTATSFVLSSFHVLTWAAHPLRCMRLLYENRVVRAGLVKCVKDVLQATPQEESPSVRWKRSTQMQTGVKALHLVAAVGSIDTQVAGKLLDLSEGYDLLKSIFSLVKKVARELEERAKTGLYKSNAELEYHLSVATGCLSVVSSLRKSIGSDVSNDFWSSAVSNFFADTESLLPTVLASLPAFSIFMKHGTKTASNRCAALHFSFVCSACNFVTVEIDSADTPQDKRAIVRILESAFEENFSHYVALSQTFLEPSLLSAFDSMVFHASPDPDSNSLFVRNLSPDHVLMHEYAEMARFPETMDIESHEKYHFLLRGEIVVVQSWCGLTKKLCNLEKNRGRGAQRANLIQSARMLQNTLRSLGEVLHLLASGNTLCVQAFDLLVAVSAASVALAASAPLLGSSDEVNTSISLILKCCTGVVTSGIDTKVRASYIASHCTHIFVQMFAFSVGQLMATLSTVIEMCLEDKSRGVYRIDDAANTTCQVVDAMICNGTQNVTEDMLLCLSISVGIIGSIIHHVLESGEEAILVAVLQERRTLQALFIFATSEPSGISPITLTGKVHRQIFALAGCLATSEDHGMIKLLANKEFAALFSADLSHRGISFRLSSLACLAAVLRGTTQGQENFKEMFQNVAVDFLALNQEDVFGILRRCCEVSATLSTHQRNQGPSQGLSMAVLRESALVFDIVGCLCSDQHGYSFKTRHSALFSRLQTTATDALASLGCFLGASASSREIFRSIKESTESASPMRTTERTLVQEAVGPLYAVLFEGVPDATHEAIRCSEFASKITNVPVSDSEKIARTKFPPNWKPEARERSASDPHTLVTLTTTRREAVTNLYSFQLEYEAARALFFAMELLRQTHPGRSSYVMFNDTTPSSLSLLPALSRGATIVFRESTGSNQPLLDCGPDTIQRGQILKTDTVHRRWLVETEYNVTKEVHISQVVGVADETNQHTILRQDPAPRFLVDISLEASIGHIVMALRWCSQFNEELVHIPGEIPGARDATRRLAEVASAVLVLEIASQNTQASSALALQILDLFGDEKELDHKGFNSLGLERRNFGRVKGVVHEESWRSTRAKLATTLARVCADENKESSGTEKTQQGYSLASLNTGHRFQLGQ